MNSVIKPVIAILACGLAIFMASCKKKDVNLGSPPAIEFKKGAGYISANATLSAGDTVVIGVTATYNNSLDRLSRLIIRRSLNNAEYSTLKELDIPEEQNKEYSYDLPLVLQTLGTQNYKFIATNTHGLQTETTITFNVIQ